MATKKVTVTLEDRQLDAVRALVAAGRTPSVSGFVQRAIDVALADAAGWREMLDEALAATGGALRRDEIAWADAILGGARPRRTRKRAA